MLEKYKYLIVYTHLCLYDYISLKLEGIPSCSFTNILLLGQTEANLIA